MNKYPIENRKTSKSQRIFSFRVILIYDMSLEFTESKREGLIKEAAIVGVLSKQVFLEILQNS